MAYDTTEAVAKFLSGFQMKITNRENGRDGLDGNAPEKDALLRNTRKRKGRSLTTSPPANGVCILSTPESVTVSMVA